MLDIKHPDPQSRDKNKTDLLQIHDQLARAAFC